MSAPAPLAYFWGEDAFSIDRAAAALAAALGGETPLDIWRSATEEDSPADAVTESGAGSSAAARRRARTLDEIEIRLGSASLFGGGTLVIARQPQALLRDAASAERVAGLLGAVAPGNALCFTELTASGAKGPAASGTLAEAVKAAGGHVREFPVPTRERMEAWVGSRAAELGVSLGPGAAQLLSERVGAYVRESDVDRRRQTELANAELEKLALFRPAGAVTREDVAELVAEAVPGSAWAFLDAVAMRRTNDASVMAARLFRDGTVLPVLITQLHRRVRELILVREHLDGGSRHGDLVRMMRLQPYRAQKLAEQAAAWTPAELESALNGLLELDLRSKGVTLDGSTAQMSDARDALGLQVWIAEFVARPAETRGPTAAGGRV